MNEILISQVYSEIIDYYERTDIEKVFSKYAGATITIINGKVVNLTEDDALCLEGDYPFRRYESDDQRESDLISIRRYLSSSFSFLMTKVFCMDLKQFRRGRTYCIYEKDYPIIKEILLRSVSQHPNDQIIVKWLKGKIQLDSYAEIESLYEKLCGVIKNIPELDPTTAEQWRIALRIVLRYDIAHTMINVENLIREVSLFSFPFSVEGDEFDSDCINQQKISERIESDLNYYCEQAHGDNSNYIKAIYQFLCTTDFDMKKTTQSFPPIDLLKIKYICESFFARETAKDLKDFLEPSSANVPQMLDEYIKYFMSIDKDYVQKLQTRKEKDHERYKRKNSDST